MTLRVFAAALVALVLSTGVAHASWYDNYETGLDAVKKGNWSKVVQEMSTAIKGNGKESNRAKTYGTIMINYHPYYYRGVAYLQLGKYEEAVADFERTSGPGPENLGSLDVLMERAKKQLASSSEPEPARVDPPPRTEPVRPATVVPQPVQQPATPQIDPALRQRATAALAEAKQKVQAAQRRAGGSQEYARATSLFADATSKLGNVRTNDDLNAIITIAGNAGDLADLATPPTAPAPIVASVPATSPLVPKPSAATTQVIESDANEVRDALEQYFAGEFEEAAKRFEALSRKMPSNGWIYAFLGAAQYSLYAFEADESHRAAALRAFRKAKQLRSWKDGLPSQYFSRKIRKAFSDEG